MKLVAWGLSALVLATLAGACGDNGRPCYPGDWRGCECPSAARGYQQCAADGRGYGACDCSGRIPGVAEADASSDASGNDGGLLPFMSSCETNESCETGLCFNFNAKGSRCSRSCAQSLDCPPPSAGCNGMGICKSP